MNFSGSEVHIGSLVSSGSLKVIGPITIAGLAEFFGDVHIYGELVLSNRQAGFAMIPKTGTSVTVFWDPPMTSTPVVTTTPDVPVLFAVTKVSATGFTIRIAGTAEEDIRFSYIALSADQPQMVMGVAPLHAAPSIPFPINELGQPLSLDHVWNGCIQGRPVLDPEGKPLSCARYHEGFVWEHPDLKISFTYKPNNEPPLLLLPPGYIATVIGGSNEAPPPAPQEEPPAPIEPVPEPEEPLPENETDTPPDTTDEGSSTTDTPSTPPKDTPPATPKETVPEPTPPPAPKPTPPAEPPKQASPDSTPQETSPQTESADPAPAPTDTAAQ